MKKRRYKFQKSQGPGSSCRLLVRWLKGFHPRFPPCFPQETCWLLIILLVGWWRHPAKKGTLVTFFHGAPSLDIYGSKKKNLVFSCMSCQVLRNDIEYIRFLLFKDTPFNIPGCFIATYCFHVFNKLSYKPSFGISCLILPQVLKKSTIFAAPVSLSNKSLCPQSWQSLGRKRSIYWIHIVASMNAKTCMTNLS